MEDPVATQRTLQEKVRRARADWDLRLETGGAQRLAPLKQPRLALLAPLPIAPQRLPRLPLHPGVRCPNHHYLLAPQQMAERRLESVGGRASRAVGFSKRGQHTRLKLCIWSRLGQFI